MIIKNKQNIHALYEMKFFDLISHAHRVHVENFKDDHIELCRLLSLKTGHCPEDCAYCPQSGHYQTSVKKHQLLNELDILDAAQNAKLNGCSRFCMGAAWKSPPEKEFLKLLPIIEKIKELGLEVCMTLGSLNDEQAHQLKNSGLDFYNHNLDTSENYYKKIISTHSYTDRLNTLNHVIKAGIKICCGGIIGMGETRDDRVDFLWTLHQLPIQPESIPLNQLIAVAGTPLEHCERIDSFEFIRTIAITRTLFPKSKIRLAAGRVQMADTLQAWCFMAGANSIFFGDTLLTAKNSSEQMDMDLLSKLGLKTKIYVSNQE